MMCSNLAALLPEVRDMRHKIASRGVVTLIEVLHKLTGEFLEGLDLIAVLELRLGAFRGLVLSFVVGDRAGVDQTRDARLQEEQVEVWVVVDLQRELVCNAQTGISVLQGAEHVKLVVDGRLDGGEGVDKHDYDAIANFCPQIVILKQSSANPLNLLIVFASPFHKRDQILHAERHQVPIAINLQIKFSSESIEYCAEARAVGQSI